MKVWALEKKRKKIADIFKQLIWYFLNPFASNGCLFVTPCRSLYFWHGFHSESEDFEANRVNLDFFPPSEKRIKIKLSKT